MQRKRLGRGVIVLGMHRSGTSAVTGVIDALGLRACRPDDRMPPRKWNARGNFESLSLTNFDERLLNQLGGTWFAPPSLSPGWEQGVELVPYLAEAESRFAHAHPSDEWVWKDPRACVLLPFWDRVLGDTPRIVVLRNPLESAASLEARNRMPRELALSLAERSVHSAFRDSAGRGVMVTLYDELLEDPAAWCRRTAGFLEGLGLHLPKPLAIAEVESFLDSALRHHREADTLGPGTGATDGLRRLWEWALGMRGAHDTLSIAGLPDESPETDQRLRAALAGYTSDRPPE
jgi:hypothetical protein